jgi:hypothetical protein
LIIELIVKPFGVKLQFPFWLFCHSERSERMKKKPKRKLLGVKKGKKGKNTEGVLDVNKNV